MNAMGGHDIEDIQVGMRGTYAKTVTEADIILFAGVTGDNNPVHIDAEAAASTMFNERIAHGMLSAGFISAVLGTKLPGPGSIYMSQSLKFLAPVKIGDTVKTVCEVTVVVPEKKRVTLKTTCYVRDKVVVDGDATMMVGARN
ncbi:MAG: MaoC family dehydratase [Sulfuritalea sp.]|jgi:3-hydroxybutyryl-CoA dehydratase|nr:MaoC family dehydratase [Sulfuritalea sp.]MBK8762452.1 MaoC family dehydratase [Sulfuritalea sp.]MBK9352366.1 MaoC family dehydratase [Sulfuritalea sp.]